MGKLSRTKGAVGERAAAKLLASVTGEKVERAARNGVDGASDLLGLPGWSCEVKSGYRVMSIPAWWRQALEQCEGSERPLLIYRSYGSSMWTVRIPLSFIDKSAIQENNEEWVEMTPESFGALYKRRAG